ncbi:hypothetical protein FACS1894211_00600 [Clostridia bacterium]|nr:hypothetical protein FACS1894211_00600 [Clostridia bacterium]
MSWQIMVPENAILISQREKLGLTQEETAKKAGVTLEQYRRYEKKGVNISSSSVRIGLLNTIHAAEFCLWAHSLIRINQL